MEVSGKTIGKCRLHGTRNAFFSSARKSVEPRFGFGSTILSAAAVWLLSFDNSALAADLPTLPVKAAVPYLANDYDWTGFYAGGSIGIATGRSNWTVNDVSGGAAPPVPGSFSLYRSPDAFTGGGSWFEGIQVGYNHMFGNRWIVGVEADMAAPAFEGTSGLSIGGISAFNSSTLGPATFSETVLSSGTVRARIGYAPGSWLLYATGGLAWTYNQQTLTQVASGTTEMPVLWRFGWAAGLGVEVPVLSHWTIRGEYLWTGYPSQTVNYPASGQLISSDFSTQQLRLGLNYRFNDATPAADFPLSHILPSPDVFAVHGQATFTEQAYPAFRSPFQGTNSLTGGAQAQEIFDATLSTGVKLWRGAELWFNPEIDQGFGLSNTHGVAGFPSAEAYKQGFGEPYARIHRAFIRQTIDLGGDTEKVDDDFYQFAGTRTADRLVITAGRFNAVDIFDTNKYANNPKADFLNWSVVNAGTFDYAADAWGYTYGAAAEWYTGRWTLRAGIFDLSETPTGGNSPNGFALDPTFQQFQMVGEIEERHELWGEPGKIKITGFLSRGRAGAFSDAVALSAATGQPADITQVRTYSSRPGISLNVEQQVNDSLGVFFRAGWADGHVESWDFTDIDRTVSGGVSINGRTWGRPDDTIGIAGVVNSISNARIAFLNAGGLGILIGDGQLPNYGTERILEAYYSYALTQSTRLTLDYQLVDNPGYNRDRGPANIFAARAHWQF